nr:hypothetical protein CFP56_03386 [Quercus suber]
MRDVPPLERVERFSGKWISIAASQVLTETIRVDCGPVIDSLLPPAAGEKLKSRIRQLEAQLESVVGVSTQNEVSKQISSHHEQILPFTGPEVLPAENSEPISVDLGTSSSNIPLSGHHTSRSLIESDISVESGLNTIQSSSTATQLDSVSWAPMEAESIDLEWLLAESGAFKNVSERTQARSPSIERHGNSDYSQRLQHPSLPQHLDPSNHVQIDSNSVQPAQESSTASATQNTGHSLPLGMGGTRLERLSLLVECAKRLGFSNLNEALSVYYTSDLSKSALMSHEQSLNRVRQLPNLLSSIREHSRTWPSWERTNYMKETLRSAEDIYVEECRVARMNLRNQDITVLLQKESQIDQMYQTTRALQQEVGSASPISMPGSHHHTWIMPEIPALTAWYDQY